MASFGGPHWCPNLWGSQIRRRGTAEIMNPSKVESVRTAIGSRPNDKLSQLDYVALEFP